MADIAEIGFKADSSDLVEAKKNLDALSPSADKAASASDKFNAMLDAVTKAANGLTGSASSLTKASDLLTSSLTRGTTATTGARTATENLNQSTKQAATGMNTTASAAATAAKATDDLTRAAKDNTTATQAQTAAQDQLNRATRDRPDFIVNSAGVARSTATVIGEPGAGMMPATKNAAGALAGAQAEADAFSGAAAAAGMASATASVEKETVKAESFFKRWRTAASNAYDGVRDAGATFGNKFAGLFGAGGAATIEKEAEAVAKAGNAAHATSFQFVEMGRIAKDLATGQYGALERSGLTLATSFKFIQSAMLPILGTLAILGIGLKEAQTNFNSDKKDDIENYANSLGLTSKELDKLNGKTFSAKKGVEETNNELITMGDTIRGFFSALGEDTNTSVFTKQWEAIKAFNAKQEQSLAESAAQIYGFFVGAYRAVTETWKDFPVVMRSFLYDVVNAVVDTTEKIINKFITAFNFIKQGINAVRSVTGEAQFAMTDQVKLGRYENPDKGTEQRVGQTFAHEMAVARDQARQGLKGFYKDWEDQSVASAKKRLAADAAQIIAGRRTPKPTVDNTRLDPFDAIVNGADNDISKTQAAIAGVNLTADAKARLANEQKLLNEADTKGLTLTVAQRAQLIALADKLSDLQVQLKNLEGFKAITDGADRSLATLKSEHDAIGLVGDAAAYYKYQTQLLNEAKSKGIELDAQQISIINQKATALAKQDSENTRDKFYSDTMVKNRADLMTALDMLTTGTDKQTTAQKLLNDAAAKNIQLTPGQRAGIIALGDQIDETNKRIENTRAALDLAKETTKGFVSNLRSNLEQGKGLFDSFATAVVNALNKVLDKMLDLAIDGLFGGKNNNGSGGLAGLLSGIGSLFGGGDAASSLAAGAEANAAAVTVPVTGFGFAKGGVFTNQIVNQRTPFTFANGGAFGEMGEAGPEAIMPLTRGPDGALGVRNHGGSSGQTNHIEVNNNYTIAGAVSEQKIVGMIQQTAEQTKHDIKKAIPAHINEYQMNGAIA